MKNEPYHILLADDDASDRMIFESAFSELKIETNVNTFQDGAKLMDWLNAPGTVLPQFIFLDLNMPRKNGMECLKEIRSNAKMKKVFVAIYSTSDNQKDMEETFLRGANVYITKPNDFGSLKQLLYKAVTAAVVYESSALDRDSFLLKL
jgi:CheY-like chemotaxis protein